MKFKEEKSIEINDSEDIKGVKSVVNPDEEDIDEEDKSFYSVNRDIIKITNEEEYGKYLKHLLGENE